MEPDQTGMVLVVSVYAGNCETGGPEDKILCWCSISYLTSGNAGESAMLFFSGAVPLKCFCVQFGHVVYYCI